MTPCLDTDTAAAPWHEVEPLEAEVSRAMRRRAIFECCKWDPQVEDVATIADVPLVLTQDSWRTLAAIAEALAGELTAAERELVERPELHRTLGLPRPVRRALRRAAGVPAAGLARLVRFDFHHTRDGWRISEANSDVPGGLNEASGLWQLITPHYPGTRPVGSPAERYVDAVMQALGPHARVGLVHATAYTDDRQVMTYLARRFEAAGVRPLLASPAHLRWTGGRARIAADWVEEPVEGIIRFFPGEWLPNLPSACGWTALFGGAATPLSNPAAALLTQSKRFPLVWDALRTPLPTWRARLPETRDPREAPWRGADDWVMKPALGRVGEHVAIAGVTAPAERRSIERHVRWFPGRWVAQRRFEATPLLVRGRGVYPCVGVYTIDGRVAGAYGRLADRPLIDHRACDAAVLVAAAAVSSGRPSPGAWSASGVGG